MIRLNDYIPGIGKIIPDIYLATNVKDFLESRDDISKPSRLKEVAPYLMWGSDPVKLLRNKVSILLENVEVTPQEFSAPRFEGQNEREKHLQGEVELLRSMLSLLHQKTEIRDLSGSVYCISPSSESLSLDETRIRQREIEAGRYVQAHLLYNVATRTQELIGLTRNGPPIKDPRVNKEKITLRDLVAAGGFA